MNVVTRSLSNACMVIILSDNYRLALRVGLCNVTQSADAGHMRG
jgi:hypothetical protein